jgi:hypothetical protein
MADQARTDWRLKAVSRLRAVLAARGARAYARIAAVTALVAIIAAVLSMGMKVPGVGAVTASVKPATVNGSHAGAEADARLFRTMHEISNNRLDAALTEIDKVISTYPNFRLAHLIKGNLLLARSVAAWRRDWESLDTGTYLSHYANNFFPEKQNLADWSQHKRKVNAGKSWIKVKIDRVSMFLYPGMDQLAVVTFEQAYTSSNFSHQTRKRQYWTKEGGRWKIIYEGSASAAPVEGPLRTG